MSGDDRWLGLRPTRFDHRWPAAELATMRAAVDGRIGMPTLDPMVTILLGTPRSESEPPFAAELRGRGLLIVADQNALWDASARLTSTQALVARWLGGRVRVTEGPKVEPLGERERRPLGARGSMYLAGLDQELRSVVSDWTTDDAIEIMRILVATAIANERREYAIAEFVQIAAFQIAGEDPPNAALMAQFEAIVNRGERPKLASGSFGPCFRPRSRKLARFELGFVDSLGQADAKLSFTAFDPNGPAAKAGLRADDSLISIDYVYGDPHQLVTLRVAREKGDRTIEYRPAGPAQQVIQWERVAGVPAEACMR